MILGSRDISSFKYDNLEGYEYVDVEYDRYEWIAPEGKKKEEKIKVGTKICRFAQFPNDKKAIMPATLQGLLAARKATRSKAKFKTVTMKNGDEHIGIVSKNEDTTTITYISLENERLKKTNTVVNTSDIKEIIQESSKILKRRGVLIIEHGYNQEDQVKDLLKDNYFSDIINIKDYQGLSRITYGILDK